MHDNMYLHVYTGMTCAFFQTLYAFACIAYESTCTTYTGIIYESTCIINIYMDYI